MKDPKDFTVDDVRTLQKEIKHFYSMRKLFLGLGFTCLLLFFVFMFVGVSIGVQGDTTTYIIFVYLSAFSFVAMIVLFVLRKALFTRRINNRKQLIREAEELRKFK